MSRRRRTYLFSLIAFALVACSDSVVEPPNTPPVELTVTPAAGTVGSVVAITGVPKAKAALEELRVVIGGVEASASQDSSGVILASIPVFLDGSGNIDPSAGRRVDVEVLNGESAVGSLENAFTVQALPSSPGAMTRASELLDQIVTGIESISLALSQEPSLEHGYATAVFAATRELITSDDPHSLKNQLTLLENDDPTALAALEGILAGSGGLAKLEEIAALASQLGLQVSKMTTLDDTDLATRMQLYVMVRDFGQQVIAQTASTWGAWLAPVFGGIGFVGVGGTVAAPGVAVVGTIGTILGLINFAINNVALAHLPSKVDAFEIRLLESFVVPGEVPQTEVWITASNQPANITILDVVDLVLNAMGVLPGSMPAGHPRRVALVQTVDYFVNIIRGQLSGYANGHPNSNLAFDVASIPHMTWTAQVTDTRYVEPKTYSPDIINPTGANILAWRATLSGAGEGRIYAQILAGPQVTSLAQLPGYTYNAGAFGDDVPLTGVVSVVVAPELDVSASMASTIAPNGANGLEVLVRSIGSTGVLLPRSGVNVNLSVSGGSADPASGTTNANGVFDTIITLDPGSTEVNVTASATDEYGRQTQATTFATAQALARVSQTSAGAGGELYGYFKNSSGSQGGTFYNVFPNDNQGGSEPQPLQASATDSRSGSFEYSSGSTVQLTSSITSSSSVSMSAAAGGITVNLQADVSGTVAVTNPPPVELDGFWRFFNKTNARASAQAWIVIEGSAAQVDVAASLPNGIGVVDFYKPGRNPTYYVCWSGGAICAPNAGANSFSGVLEPGTYIATVNAAVLGTLGNEGGPDARSGSLPLSDGASMTISVTPVN